MSDSPNVTPPPPVPPAPPVAPPPAPGPAPASSSNGPILAGLGYIFWIVPIIMLLMEPYKDDPFVKFHAIQALALGVASIILWMIPVVGWILGIVVLVFEIIALINAFQGKMYEVPWLGGQLKQWFDLQ